MNEKNLKGSNIMFMRKKIKNERNNRQRAIDMELSNENRRRNIIRIDIEGQTTDNAYTENECGFIVARFDDERLTANDRDIRAYFNDSCEPLSESNIQETEREFNRRQFRILQQLKKKIEKEDKKYE